MFKMKVEGLGSVVQTPKGFLRQFLFQSESGKEVIKIFSKDPDAIAGSGVIEIAVRQDFFFAETPKVETTRRAV